MTDFVTAADRAPVKVLLPGEATERAKARLLLGTVAGQPRVLVYVAPGTLVLDEAWNVGASEGLPNYGAIWSVATAAGPLRVVPTRGCSSCGGSWWRHQVLPFPEQRGPTLARMLRQAG